MFFMLPIRTSIRPWRPPYANYGLILANILIFLLTYWPHRNPFTGTAELFRPWADQFILTSIRPYLWQFVSYAFLHANLGHILGNMYFLYLFGNNVNDKLGNIGYVSFYLAGAIFAGIGHVIVSPNDILGASGAVAAVTGAYLVLFPQTLITVFYWLVIFINTIEIPALYLIGFKLIFWDNMVERAMPNVAYDAHLSGYAFGILATLGLLSTGFIAGSSVDLWAMVRQWNRRRRYRDAVAAGYDPFTGLGPTAKRIEVKEVGKSPVEREKEERIRELRTRINTRIAQRNFPAAAEAYLQLIQLDSKQVLPRQHLLDIANQLAAEGRHAQAADAYETFLAHYGNYEYIEQVELMLGILYSRYLNKPRLAIKHLRSAETKLLDPGQKKLCEDELARLQD